jgi:hypothetical protein
MPDRIIRDELLESPRFLSLKDNADRLAYIALLLSADDLGNFDGDLFRLVRLWRDFGIATRELAAKTLSELTDADLVRVYQVDGKSYVHLPRFRQRLRYVNGKFPRPPEHIDTCKINALQEKRQTKVRPQSGLSQAQDGRSEEKRSEVKRSKPHAREVVPVDNFANRQQTPDGDKSPKDKPETLSATGQWWKTNDGIAAKAREVGLQARPGKSFADLKDDVFAYIHARQG